MNYIDGFVAAVPTANREAFRRHAEAAAAVFREHGALGVSECWGDDVPDGTLTSFPHTNPSKKSSVRSRGTRRARCSMTTPSWPS